MTVSSGTVLCEPGISAGLPVFLGDRPFPSCLSSVQFSRSVASDSVAPGMAASQASLSITNSRSLLKLMSIESVMPSNHLILCHPLLLLSSIFPSIRVFSKESLVPELAASSWILGPACLTHIKPLGKINGPPFLHFPT